jgi:uncharacterized protein
MLASYNGHASLVSLLLSNGADPNRLNDRGQSPLAGVVFKHEPECVRLLLEGGADPEIGTPSALEACRVSWFSLFCAVTRLPRPRARGVLCGVERRGRRIFSGALLHTRAVL